MKLNYPGLYSCNGSTINNNLNFFFFFLLFLITRIHSSNVLLSNNKSTILNKDKELDKITELKLLQLAFSILEPLTLISLNSFLKIK
jgi:hypothetical protein